MSATLNKEMTGRTGGLSGLDRGRGGTQGRSASPGNQGLSCVSMAQQQQQPSPNLSSVSHR